MASKIFSKKNIVAVIISLIMITSVIGFVSLNSLEKEYRYNGHTFTRDQDGYHIVVDKRELVFTYLPGDLSDVNISGNSAAALKHTRLIMASSQLDSASAQGIAGSVYYLRNALAPYNIYVLSGFTNQGSRPAPVISCKNATIYIPVIVFEDANTSEVITAGNCIRVQVASPEYPSKFTQKVVYTVAGIV